MSDSKSVRLALQSQIESIESEKVTAHSVLRNNSCVESSADLCSDSNSFSCAESNAESSVDSCAESSADEIERAFRKVERLACMQEQASAALLKRLSREGFSEEASRAAVERALACGLVDDERYANVLVRSRLSQGKGIHGIACELEDLGMDPSCVQAFQEAENSGIDEVKRAISLLERKPPQAKNKRDAAYRRLVQKGFTSSVASSAARQWCEMHAT